MSNNSNNKTYTFPNMYLLSTISYLMYVVSTIYYLMYVISYRPKIVIFFK